MAKPVVWDWWLALDVPLRAQALCVDPLITSLFVHLLEKGLEAGQMIADILGCGTGGFGRYGGWAGKGARRQYL